EHPLEHEMEQGLPPTVWLIRVPKKTTPPSQAVVNSLRSASHSAACVSLTGTGSIAGIAIAMARGPARRVIRGARRLMPPLRIHLPCRRKRAEKVNSVGKVPPRDAGSGDHRFGCREDAGHFGFEALQRVGVEARIEGRRVPFVDQLLGEGV